MTRRKYDQDPAVPLAGKLRGFYVGFVREHPDSRLPSPKDTCRILKIEYAKHARHVRNIRLQVERNKAQTDVWIGTGRLEHRREYGPVDAPKWIVGRALEAAREGRNGWKLVSSGAGGRVPYCRHDFGCGSVRIYVKSGRMIAYEGAMVRDTEGVRRAVTGVLSHLGPSLTATRAEELGASLDDLFDAKTSHIPVGPIPGFGSLPANFKARIPELGLTVRRDGSHPRFLEFEVRNASGQAQAVRELKKTFELLAGRLDAVDTAVRSLADLSAKQVSATEGIGLALAKNGEGLGKVAEALEKNGEGFAAVRRLLGRLLPESGGAGSDASQKTKPPDPKMFS